MQLRLALFPKVIFAKMYPNLVSVLEDHRFLVGADLVGVTLHLALDGELRVLMHFLHEVGTRARIHVCAFL